jgi:hypothetical protein
MSHADCFAKITEILGCNSSHITNIDDHISVEIITDNKDQHPCIERDQLRQKRDNIVDNIKNIIDKQERNLLIVKICYKKIYRRYYVTTLVTLILATMVTFIEAFRLGIIDYIHKNEVHIDEYLLTLLMNVITLCMGTCMTIISGFIRFKNYRELLENLHTKQDMLVEYIMKFKQTLYHLDLLFIRQSTTVEELDKELKTVINDITEYEYRINSINIIQVLQDIKNKDIINYYKDKAEFELKFEEIRKELNENKNKLMQCDMQKPKGIIKNRSEGTWAFAAKL